MIRSQLSTAHKVWCGKQEEKKDGDEGRVVFHELHGECVRNSEPKMSNLYKEKEGTHGRSEEKVDGQAFFFSFFHK